MTALGQSAGTTAPENLAAEIAALQAALAAERTARQEAEARASGAEAMVAQLKLLIARLRREQYGQSSERGRKLLDQLELQLEEVAASAAEDEITAAPVGGTMVHPFTRRNRGGEHPARHLAGYAGILQADAYAGFGDLYDSKRKPGPIAEAACWSHGRRHFFELADLRKAPLAVDAVRRIDALFALERTINGLAAGDRLAVRRRESKPIVVDLEKWMRAERARLSRHAETARAIDYMLTRWPAFTRFLDDGRICLSNNAAERALRAIALGRRAWLFVGSDRGGERAAAIYTLIATAKLNDINPLAWLADVLARIADHPASHLYELLPWYWKATQDQAAAAA